MKLRIGFLMLAAGLVASCGGADTGEQAASMPAAEPTDVSSAEAAIDQVRADYMTAYNNHDAAGVAALFGDSATMLEASGAVEMGRGAIESGLTEQMAGSPMVQIDGAATMVFGDMAMNRGTYTLNMTAPDGTSMSTAGSYMSGLQQVDGAWKIMGLITNLNAPPPEGYPMATWEGERPPDAGTMTALVNAYVTAFNAGDAAAVAALHTDDAVLALANEPVAMGRAAIEAALAQGISAGSPQLEVHDVYTMPIEGGYAVDSGWFRTTATTPDGTVTSEGTYMALNKQEADGSWKIHWMVTNEHPASMQD
jgi:uncharacterized protein (TIGR02246 family)